MSLRESEFHVLGILGLVILILWAFFGLVWSFLLVFTFLIYAYNFGRQQERSSSHDIGQDEPDVSFQEKLHAYYSEFQDLQFTGPPKRQFTLRSPVPLLSEVTKRLSFNTSTIPQYTPHQARKAWHINRQHGNPYLTGESPVAYWRKSNHFSLLNPALQRPSTVKIASPDVTFNRTFNFPLKRTSPEQVNPCSRATVLSALKESRKRSYVGDEDDDLELSLRPTKRRGTNSVSSKTVDSTHENTFLRCNRMFSGGLKRTALQDNKETTTEENTNKKSKIIDHTTVQSADHRNSVLQKRKNVETESTHATSKEDTEESKSKKVKNSTENDECHRPAATAKEDTHMEDSSAISDINIHEEDTRINSHKEHKENSKKRSSTGQMESVDVKKHKETISKGTKLADHQDRDDVIQQPDSKAVDNSKKNQKRFIVPRFASKEDSRRRAVPVYCASNEESEMPQRRKVSRKINQEQISIDRKLAWERVKKFLDDDDEEEEEEDLKECQSKTGTTATPSTAATPCMSSSLFKISSGHAVSSTGTLTTITTQSLVTPALSTGFPKPTTGTPLSTASGAMQGSSAVAQPQSSAGSLLQSQRSLKSELVSNLITTGRALSTATTKQDNVVTAVCANESNPSLGTVQANTLLTSTVTSLSAPGCQINSSSSSSLGNFSFLKSKTTGNLTSLSDSSSKSSSTTSFQLSASIVQSSGGSSLPSSQPSSQKPDFVFPAVSSSGASTSTITTTREEFNFSVPSVTRNAFSLDKTVSKNSPGAAVINSTNTFTLTTSTSQNPAAFGVAGNTLTPTTQNPFGSLAKPTAAVSSAHSSGIFGQNTITAQNSSCSTTLNKGAFGSSRVQSLSASTQQTQSASSGNFGASPFTQTSFGTQSNQIAAQSAFGSSATQNTVGMQQSQPASQSAFRSSATQNAFTSEAVKTKNSFGSQADQSAGQSVFGNQNVTLSALGNQAAQSAFCTPQQPTTQNAFGTQATQNAFGTQATQNAFGTQATQNAFGAQLNQPTNQSAFGAPSNQALQSTFSFAPNAAQTTTNSPFSSFSNKPSTQSAFGATPAQNAAGTSGGFNFGATASNTIPGSFNFNVANNKTGGFQYGSGSNSSFSGFGQVSAQATNPVAMPAPPTPSGGFNFTPGAIGTMESAFASSTPAPAFGAPSTPQGGNSTLTAKTRARLAARRRGKK